MRQNVPDTRKLVFTDMPTPILNILAFGLIVPGPDPLPLIKVQHPPKSR
jgi:hypothetical protein